MNSIRSGEDWIFFDLSNRIVAYGRFVNKVSIWKFIDRDPFVAIGQLCTHTFFNLPFFNQHYSSKSLHSHLRLVITLHQILTSLEYHLSDFETATLRWVLAVHKYDFQTLGMASPCSAKFAIAIWRTLERTYRL